VPVDTVVDVTDPRNVTFPLQTADIWSVHALTPNGEKVAAEPAARRRGA
jgi:hypothetical protein